VKPFLFLLLSTATAALCGIITTTQQYVQGIGNVYTTGYSDFAPTQLLSVGSGGMLDQTYQTFHNTTDLTFYTPTPGLDCNSPGAKQLGICIPGYGFGTLTVQWSANYFTSTGNLALPTAQGTVYGTQFPGIAGYGGCDKQWCPTPSYQYPIRLGDKIEIVLQSDGVYQSQFGTISTGIGVIAHVTVTSSSDPSMPVGSNVYLYSSQTPAPEPGGEAMVGLALMAGWAWLKLHRVQLDDGDFRA
jgi:hypothetical protein